MTSTSTLQKASEAKAAERRPGADLRDAIKRSESQFAMALPRHVGAERFVRCALTAINTVPKLAWCSQTSILAGLMQAAQLGLEVSDVRGQAYLIPRQVSLKTDDGWRKEWQATFQLGYRGMIDLAARAGITVDVDVIYENDTYDFQRGTDAKLHHRPTLGDPGSPIAYYAVAHFADSRRPAFLLMSVAQVERHRDRFAQKDRDGNPPKVWVEHFDAMAIKTVIRRLLDKLPTSAELRQQVIEATAAADDAAPMPHLAVVPQMELPEADSELLADTNVIDVATGEITEAAQ